MLQRSQRRARRGQVAPAPIDGNRLHSFEDPLQRADLIILLAIIQMMRREQTD